VLTRSYKVEHKWKVSRQYYSESPSNTMCPAVVCSFQTYRSRPFPTRTPCKIPKSKVPNEAAFPVACTRCVIVTGTPQLSGAKFSQYAVYLHKNFRAKAWDNAAWNATRIVHHMYCLYRVTSLSTWCELNQRVIDTAVRQWRTRLRACVKTKHGHFEHKLSQ